MKKKKGESFRTPAVKSPCWRLPLGGKSFASLSVYAAGQASALALPCVIKLEKAKTRKKRDEADGGLRRAWMGCGLVFCKIKERPAEGRYVG